jgi:hypothetical protein
VIEAPEGMPADPSSLPPMRASSDPRMSERGVSHATMYRDAYVQLITEFNEADSSEAKRRVSERLDQARKSDNSLVRYYAVRAMSRLDIERFAAELEASEPRQRSPRSCDLERCCARGSSPAC